METEGSEVRANLRESSGIKGADSVILCFERVLELLRAYETSGEKSCDLTCRMCT